MPGIAQVAPYMLVSFLAGHLRPATRSPALCGSFLVCRASTSSTSTGLRSSGSAAHVSPVVLACFAHQPVAAMRILLALAAGMLSHCRAMQCLPCRLNDGMVVTPPTLCRRHPSLPQTTASPPLAPGPRGASPCMLPSAACTGLAPSTPTSGWATTTVRLMCLHSLGLPSLNHQGPQFPAVRLSTLRKPPPQVLARSF